MAKAALEAINGFNVFGDKGAEWSTIYVDIDAHNRNRTIFETLLPRESSSKVRTVSLMTMEIATFRCDFDRSRLNPLELLWRQIDR